MCCAKTLQEVEAVEALCDMLHFGGPAMVQCAKLTSLLTIPSPQILCR
jgi:hypothetical protein